MTDTPERDAASVETGRFYPYSPHRIWDALTDAALVEQWLMPSVGLTDLRVGSQFVFAVPTEPPGEIACKVLALDPCRQLTLRWVDLRAQRPARWTVEWTLRPQGRGARLFLTHSGFDISDRRQKMARNGMERMWNCTLTQLSALLDGTTA